MKFKQCTKCGKNLPDTNEYFNARLRKGGIWGTTPQCKKCMAFRASELRTIREVKKLLEENRVSN